MNELTIEVVEAISLSIKYLASILDDITAAGKVALEKEKQPEYPEIMIMRDRKEISNRLGAVLARNFWMRYEKRNATIGDLSSLSRNEVMGFRNMGVHTMEELEEIMKKYGVHFRGEDKS